MSADAFVKVWEQSRHSGTALLVMLALADDADLDGYVSPDIERLAKKSRCTVEQLFDVIVALITSGELRPVDAIECRLKCRHHHGSCYQVMLCASADKPNSQRCGSTYTKQVISPRLRTAVLERDGCYCRNCGATEELSIDHIVPERLGGTLDPANLQVLCRSCNSRKGARAI